MNRVEIVAPFVSLIAMRVCAVKDASDEEVLEVCNRDNHAGTQLGWCTVARENYEREEARPITCSENADRVHLMVLC